MRSDSDLLGEAPLSQLSDEALIHDGRHGDERAFEELYRRHAQPVFAFLLHRLRDRQVAEEATQDVFLKAFSARGDEVTRARPWLFAIARNLLIDRVRRDEARRAHDALVLDEVAEVAADGDSSAFWALDVPSNVFLALRRLKSRERRALVMREFQDRSSGEIAADLGMSTGAVDVLMSRARASFGRAYDQVTQLPFACRQATELIYRDLGSGISDHKRESMHRHIADCPRCALEYRLAHSPKMLSGLLSLPWIHSIAEVVLRSPLAPAAPLAGAAVGLALTVAVVGPAVTGSLNVASDEHYGARLAVIDLAPNAKLETTPAEKNETVPRDHRDAATEPDHHLYESHAKTLDERHATDDGAHARPTNDGTAHESSDSGTEPSFHESPGAPADSGTEHAGESVEHR